MCGGNGPGALTGAAEADGNGVFAERRSDTTLFAVRLLTIGRLRRKRHVERLYSLDARAVFELDEIARHHGIGDDLDRRLARYATVDPVILAAVGGDRFARTPIRAIGGDDG
jgi:hypothetical protein